jgi:hypothetical protein
MLRPGSRPLNSGPFASTEHVIYSGGIQLNADLAPLESAIGVVRREGFELEQVLLCVTFHMRYRR